MANNCMEFFARSLIWIAKAEDDKVNSAKAVVITASAILAIRSS